MHKVLIVDDEPLIRWAVREVLEGAGYATLEAGTAREALSYLQDGQRDAFAVALLDLRLPDSDDLSLLCRIRDLAPHCQVIMMTAHGTSELMTQAIQAGAFSTISKPFDLVRLVGLVQAAEAVAS
ncbi:MAG TPA: response regulator [Vicinamibacterales bacterium]|nr:response regulator [Vicinamibacterales bacterium]